VVQQLAARAYFELCRALGWLLRSARYSTARIADVNGKRRVQKHRRFYAPLLVRMGNLLLKVLDTGVQILAQGEWEARERQIYQSLYRTSIQVDADGVLVLPLLSGRTLAALLEDPALDESRGKRAIERAAVALAELHRLGLTHADAMAENVLVDLEAGVAHWFDFETVHDSRRPMAWRRADDVRALLATCLIRTISEKRADTLALILDSCADEDVTRVLAASFTSAWRRSLSFHLAQAGLPLSSFRDIGRLLQQRSPHLT
jgi:serine/threonine protein kinase